MRGDDQSVSYGNGRRRSSWRIDRLQKMHELGRAFGVTEDSTYPPVVDPDEQEPEPLVLLRRGPEEA